MKYLKEDKNSKTSNVLLEMHIFLMQTLYKEKKRILLNFLIKENSLSVYSIY